MNAEQFRDKVLADLQLIDTRLECIDNHINRIEHKLRIDFD